VSASAASNDPRPTEEGPFAGSAVAWCEHCERVVEHDEAIVSREGALRCPECNEELVATGDDDAPPKAPWHFKVLLVGTVCYLIYRFVWFIFWLSHHA
jgi:hypothetical protein